MEFLMPRLSDTMEEGTVLTWLKADGDDVAKGEPLAEIETDKATMTVEAPASGRLAILLAEGDTAPVGATIATIGDAAGAPARSPAADTPAVRPEPVAPVQEGGQPGTAGPDEGRHGLGGRPPAGTLATSGLGEAYPGSGLPGRAEEEEAGGIPVTGDGTATEIRPPAPGAATPGAEPASSPPVVGKDAGRLRASPLARTLAAQLGVDLAAVRGTGPGGRIVKADVQHAVDAPGAASPARTPEAGATAPATPPASGERTPLSRLQRTVARRMVESATTVPQFTVSRDVDVTLARALREQLRQALPNRRPPGLNDLILRAVAIAAGERRELLARFDGDALVAASGVHVGFAVALPRGLVVPVIRDADRKSLAAIVDEAAALIEAVRSGTAPADALEGSTISVSNLGMYGVDRFTAIVNPPETMILAVGRAAERAAVVDGAIAPRALMTATLSVDHRAVYGADAAAFLARVAELLEAPAALLL